MMQKIEGLPANVIGVRAEGRVTKEDYESLLIPMLEDQRRQGKRIRLLYQLGPEFDGLTAGAVWEDSQVGFKYLRLFDACAVVTDVEWIRKATDFFGSFMPCPVRNFRIDQANDAAKWLGTPGEDAKMKFELSDDGVLVLHPEGPLRREDFDKLASVVDPWLETHSKLKGVVISVKQFPGWENFGSFIHHMTFVGSHHRKVKRIALAADGALPTIISKVASHFVEAEIKQFPFDQLKEATQWAKD